MLEMIQHLPDRGVKPKTINGLPSGALPLRDVRIQHGFSRGIRRGRDGSRMPV